MPCFRSSIRRTYNAGNFREFHGLQVKKTPRREPGKGGQGAPDATSRAPDSKQTHARNARRRFFKHLQSLGGEFVLQKRDTGGIASRRARLAARRSCTGSALIA